MLDELIRTAASLIHAILGKKDNLYHVGTASLAVLMEEGERSWRSLVEVITAQLKQPLSAAGIPVTLTAMRSLAGSPRDQVLVQSMITMAHDIGYRVVAEGVETEAVLEFLRTAKCDEVQGYLFARPLAADRCTAYFGKTGVPGTASRL